MNIARVSLALLAVALSAAVTGCKKETQAPSADELKKGVEQTAPSLPAAQKPKDHPAH